MDVAWSNLCKITSHYSKFKSFQQSLQKVDWKSKRYKNLGVKDDIASVKGNKKNGALAQLARAPALQAGCQGFESLMLHH